MPAGQPVLTLESLMLCAHAGHAQVTVVVPPDARVLIEGLPLVTVGCVCEISGCALEPPAVPCATANWVVGASRVSAGGLPVVLAASASVCVPTETGLQVIVAQERVSAV
jgi:hypothetical protein